MHRRIPLTRKLAAFLGLWVSLQPLAASPAQSAVVHRPKLVIVLVIDQFRADYLLRFENRFKPAREKNGDVGGFEYLMTQGAYYPMAEYGILQSMTCPGHATILTGAYPYQAGIPINGWYDAQLGRFVYCAEDPNVSVVGVPPHEYSAVSPHYLAATTVGDELKNAGLNSHVVAVALKDRAAIMLGGHRADLAFWMDSRSRNWVTSTFYRPDGKLPDWLLALNREVQPKAGETVRWTPEGPGNGLSDESYRPTRHISKVGKEFPHELPTSDKYALSFPYGMELTEQAAERAYDAYKLGRGNAPDMLEVSFSSHDYVGHAFGPNSREMEEMTIHEDRILAKLLNHVRKTLPGGLKDVVIALTGDHGAPPAPEWAVAHRIEAGSLDEEAESAEFEKILTDKFGAPRGEKWIGYNHDYDIYINRKAVAARKADLAEVLATLKAQIEKQPGVMRVVTLQDVEAGHFPPGLYGEQFKHTYVPGRSGDITVIPKPFWMVDGGDEVTHLTGYTYDRMVPLVLAGAGLRASVHPEYARVIDLAPTLSYLLGILPPSLSEGRVLTEALQSPAQGPAKSR